MLNAGTMAPGAIINEFVNQNQLRPRRARNICIVTNLIMLLISVLE